MAVIKEKGRWVLHETAGKKTWTAEVSELQHSKEDQKCPVCSHSIKFSYSLGGLAPVKDKEGDIQMWKGTCCCGTELTIFND